MSEKKLTPESAKCFEYSQYRWFMLAAAVLAMFCAQIATMSFAPVMGTIAEDLGISLGTASFGFMGMNLFSTAIGVMVAGLLADKIGINTVILGGLVLILLANSAFSIFGYSYTAVVIIRMIEAVGVAPALIAIQPIVAYWFPDKEHGLAFGLNAFCILGPVLSGVIGSKLILSASNWQNGMLYYSLVFFIITILVTIIILGAGKHLPPTMESKKNIKKEVKFDFRKVFRYPAFWIGLFIMILANWTTQTFNDFSPTYLAVDAPVGVGYGAETAGSLSALTWVGMMFGMFFSGFLIDKAFKGKAMPIILIGFISNIILINGILSSSVYSSKSILTIWLMVAGVFSPFVSVGNQCFSVKVFTPNVMGKVSAIWTCAGNFAGSAGVMVGSFALHVTGNYKLSFALITTICALGVIIALFSRQRQERINIESSITF
ncbi:MFS transporter [Clostridium sp. SHJSY1]|uniref:MFS transporter n=1 Tax=Clostridium sp. SHJSY1 TaxID=2942483 RepID=UPI002876F223|nr:MFS transporter [Clostridium sp. SHJSY1]MDS0526014.1 MFS transporter [Clostridium sp. SHJSY1]